MFPKLFEIDLSWLSEAIGKVVIHTYGLILAISFLAGFIVFLFYMKKNNLSENVAYDLFFYIVISSLIGSKLSLIFVEWRFYIQHPKEIIYVIARYGGVFYGGLLAAIIVSVLFLKHKKLPILKITDCASPGIALGLSIGRWACLSAGCCYGSYSDLPWAIIYKDRYAAETVGTPLGIPLHPTPIYESIAAFLIFLFLILFMRTNKKDGMAFSILLIAMGVERFIIEFFRGDDRGFIFNGLLSISQFIAILIAVSGVVILIALINKNRLH